MSSAEPYDIEAVAVVGMAGRFPGSGGVRELWRHLIAGVEAISYFSDEELAEAGVDAEVYRRPEYVRAKGVLEGSELFDAGFFGLTAREAEVMDPQNRVFLECCWTAAEDAGYDLASYDGRAGVYAGASLSTYLLSNLMSRPDVIEQVGPLQIRIANEKDSLATWAAYKLDLHGPCVAVQTACSTSLVAVHFACQGLLDGDCDLALAGGVSVTFPAKIGYLFQEGGILSPDGRCRSFDAEAKGSVPGNGAGVVVLRRLADALADGDAIRAVIRGTAITNDGAQRAGYTAPGVEGQMRAVAEALSIAEVAPDTVGFVECHGSGTALGDPIEIEALTKAFRRGTARKGFCAVGSAKANLGHLDAAAGVTGLIKTVCALEARKLPPTPHFERPNPAIDFAASPFYVVTEPRDWPRPAEAPRRAGVSSFGIGGTNAHAVLEEAPQRDPGGPSRPWQQLLLSARSEAALEAAAVDLLTYLKSDAGAETDLADVAYTLKVGRRPFRHRLAVVCRGRDDALAVLEGREPERRLHGASPPPERPAGGVAFLFPGLGDHYPGMGLELYRSENIFRRTVDECAEILKPRLGLDLREALFPGGTDAEVPTGTPGRSAPDLRRLAGRDAAGETDDDRRLDRTRLAHPVVFTFELALARQLMEWGLAPREMVGYSLGEYVAACVAGVFSLEEALEIVAERARLIDELPAGAMLAVPLAEAELRPWLAGSELALAAVNGSSLAVVGGPPEAVAELAGRLQNDGVACRKLKTTHAFHSPLMEPIRARFVESLTRRRLAAPQIPFASNVTGDWIRDEEATDPAYWGRHLVATVRFTEGLARVFESGRASCLLEVGPGQALTTLARQHQTRGESAAFPALPGRHDGVSDLAAVLTAVSRLWIAGAAVDWRGYYRRESRRRTPLPTYPFERRPYWIEPGTAAAPPALRPPPARRAEREEQLYVAGWRRTGPVGQAAHATAPAGRWLLFLDPGGVGERLAERLRLARRPVTTVEAGADFAAPAADDAPFLVDPGQRRHYSALLAELERREALPARIVHLWNVPPEDGDWSDPEALRAHLERAFYSLLFLAQALGERQLPAARPVEIAVVSSQLHDVVGGETICPPKATLLGPCRVISQEYPRLECRSVDVDLAAGADRAAAGLATELASGSGDAVVAYRGDHRWVRTVEPLAVERPGAASRLRQGGVYLVTGADETALAVAEHLATTAAARVALIVPPGPHPLPLSPGERGVETVIEADLSDFGAVAAAVESAGERLGAVHGVVHAASMAGAGVIQLKEAADAAAVLAPKVAGTLALAAATRDLELDFLVIFSSTVALTGGIGQVDSCAASAFADAFAETRRGAGRTLSIGWDAFRWQEPHPSLPPELARQLEGALALYGIEAQEMAEIFDRLLATALPHAWASTRRLSEVVRELTEHPDAGMLGAGGPAERAAHDRPDLETPYREPSTETEKALADVWRDVIGTDRVGVDDDFFALDGNSLIALQIATRVRSVLGVELPLATLFAAPTVGRLAARVDELRREARELAEAEALLAEVESLSSEEAELLLASEGGER